MVEKLKALRQKLEEKNEFKPGDIVQWKLGLSNKRSPEYNEKVIVMGQLETPLVPEKDSGSAYFQEPLDLIIGFTDSDGDFVTFHVDSRRFEHAE